MKDQELTITFPGHVEMTVEELNRFLRSNPTKFIDQSHPECYCQECGGVNTSWYALNGLYNLVTGTVGEGIICPNCFIQKAREKGINVTFKAEIIP